MNSMVFKYALSTLAVFIIISGCTHFGSGVVGGTLPAVKKAAKENIDVGEVVVKKVAVIPFFNISGSRDAGTIVADIYVTELFNDERYKIEEPGNVRQFVIQEGILNLGELSLDRIAILGRRLGVDGVFIGTIEEYATGRFGVPVVSMNVRLVESDTGRVVWSARHKRTGDDYVIVFDFGRVSTPPMLAQKMTKEMLKTLSW